MINYIWGIMMILGTAFSVINGKGKETGLAAINSSKEAITLCIAMFGVMGLWMGIMEIAMRCGLISKMSKVLNPLIEKLFPDIPKDNKAREYIVTNFIANILGLGWAATPVGLKAMEELSKINRESETASYDMCTFLIINISSLQLIPINIIAYRSQYGSVNPSSIIGKSMVATIISTIAGIIFAIFARNIYKKIDLKTNNM